MKCFYKIEDNSLVIDNAFDYASGSRTVRASDRINNFYVFLPKQGDITQNVSVLGVFKRQDGKVSIPKAMHYSGDETVDGVEFVKFEMAMQPFDLFLSGQLEVNVKVVYPDGTSQLSSIELFTIESANDAICDETLDSTCVDEVLGLIATKANVSDTGLSEKLITDDKSNIVAGVNEVKDIASRLDISVDELDTRIGSLDGLETDNKTDIVNAVNEVKGGVDGIHNIIDNSYNFYIVEEPHLYSDPDNPPLNQIISLNEIIGLNEEITLKIGDYLWITFYNNEGYSKVALYTIYAIGASYATGRILNAMPSISTLTYQEIKDIISSVDALRKISDLQDDTLTNPINLSSVSNIAYKDRDGLEIKDTYSKIGDIKDNLISTDINKPLSANQGKVLRELIEGKEFAEAYNTIEDMVINLNSANEVKYRTAYNFYIVDLDVPDFWITEVMQSSVPYVYTSDSDLIDAVKQAPLQIGYYKVSMLETAKVDLTDYVKNTRKVAGMPLESDISIEDLQEALEVPELPIGEEGQVLAFDSEGNIIATDIESGGSDTIVVNTIAERDALENLSEGTKVYVKDASDDVEVGSGWAEYIYVDNAFKLLNTGIKADVTVKLMFNYNGADGNNDILESIVHFGETFGELPQPTRTDYNFIGWSYEQDNLDEVIDEENYVDRVGDVNLYAIWSTGIGLSYSQVTIDGISGYAVSKGSSNYPFIQIPEMHNGLPVISIANGGFLNVSTLASIFIPASVREIGENVFYGNILSKIVVADESQYFKIVDNALFSYDMQRLIKYPSGLNVDYYKVPDTVKEVGSVAFEGCKIKKIYIGKEVESIGTRCFSNTEAIVEFQKKEPMSSDLTIKEKAFAYYLGKKIDFTNLFDLFTERNNIIIASQAFFNANNLQSISLIGALSIGDRAFSDCSSLESVEMSSIISEYEHSIFLRCANLKEVYWLEADVSSLSDSMFSSNMKLQRIDIPKNVMSIGDHTFKSCGLKEITLPSSIETLGTSFQNCRSLQTVTVNRNASDGVPEIGVANSVLYGTFWDCTSLESIYVPSDSVDAYIQAWDGKLPKPAIDLIKPIGGYIYK